MNLFLPKRILSLTAVLALAGWGCAKPSLNTSVYHPGPVAGRAAGNSVGVVAGNGAALGVGAFEGIIEGFAAPFDNTTMIVRHWQTQATPDGRTNQVPVETLFNASGDLNHTSHPPALDPAESGLGGPAAAVSTSKPAVAPANAK